MNLTTKLPALSVEVPEQSVDLHFLHTCGSHIFFVKKPEIWFHPTKGREHFRSLFIQKREVFLQATPHPKHFPKFCAVHICQQQKEEIW